ncbi:hypothetical protein IAR55_000419 [Kwoniella newhampshirensis]|uniref:IC97/Casc1 N-terminal domain-containing protein n=1 Tax=Kwoniella newhampshirensis TaxID=1651941 RepID=A0AAW0Z730_9TREE
MPYSYVDNPSASSSKQNSSRPPPTPGVWARTPEWYAREEERLRLVEAQRTETERRRVRWNREQDYIQAEFGAAARFLDEQDKKRRLEREEKREEEETMETMRLEREERESGIPYYTPVIGARAGFNDMPREILSKIVGFSKKKYPFLFLNTETCHIAGPMIYQDVFDMGTELKDVAHDDDDAPTKESAPIDIKFGIGGVLLGLEHSEPTTTVPFGREMKLRFLRDLRGLVEEQWWSNSRTDWQERNMFPLDKARLDGIVVFPFLDKIVFNQRWASSREKTSNTNESHQVPNLHLTLAAVSCPKYFCWWTPASFDQLRSGDLFQSELIFPFKMKSSADHPQHANEGPQRHIPLAVCHHQTTATSLPLVCYGTLKRVDFWQSPHDGSYHSETSIGQLGLRQRADLIINILHLSHPELEPDETKRSSTRSRLSDEELIRRDRTTWEFSQVGSDNAYTASDDDEDGWDWWEMCEKVKELVLADVVPELRGRIKFEEEGGELDRCGSCGMCVPFDAEGEAGWT